MNNLEEVCNYASKIAEDLGHNIVTTDHIIVPILMVPSIIEMFKSFDIDVEDLKNTILEKLSDIESPDISIIFNDADKQKIIISPILNNVLLDIKKRSVIEQLRADEPLIEPYFILYECLAYPKSILSSVLQRFNTTPAELALNINDYTNKRFDIVDEQSNLPLEPASGKRSSKNFKIEDYTTNLTALAKDGKLDPLIGREVELNDMLQILSRKKKKNPILVGEAGVGKTEIIYGLSQRIADSNVPDNLKEAKVLSLNLTALSAGTRYRGDFEERLDFIMKEVEKDPEIILFIDEIHMIMSAGSSTESGNMANSLKPALSEGTIRIIGATTIDEYRKNIENDSALSRRFVKILVGEPSISDTLLIINGIKESYEKHHNVTYSDEAINTILKLSDKYIKTKHFPDKAIDLLDASGARLRLDPREERIVNPEDVQFEVARITSISYDIIASTENDLVVNLRDNLHKKVFGQDDAINTLVSNVMIAHAGLRDNTSIRGAFLFVGSSGTGKTEIAKVLADSLGEKLIRFDMSEFSAEHTVSKLIGSPPGYVGHDTGNGQLLDKIEDNPNCILLLDEIEKAHPNVMLPLLQVMDEGHLTGSKGKTVYFNNVTIIMTTNLGSRDSNKKSLRMGDTTDGIDKAVKAFLPPEFINRIDAIIKFNELSLPVLRDIVGKFVSNINTKLIDRNVTVKLDKKAIDWFANNGDVKSMGARPIKRLLANEIEIPLAPRILSGEVSSVVHVTVDKNNKIVLK